MMTDQIEHTEHRRPATAPDRGPTPVAWSGPAPAAAPPAPEERSRA